jgi:hypothetical protein
MAHFRAIGFNKRGAVLVFASGMHGAVFYAVARFLGSGSGKAAKAGNRSQSIEAARALYRARYVSRSRVCGSGF